MSVAGSMAQVNVRVDRSVKERAEEALRLSGGSLPELIKKVVAKVAQGGGQCEEVLAAVDDRQQTVAHDTPFAASWAAAGHVRNLLVCRLCCFLYFDCNWPDLRYEVHFVLFRWTITS